MAEKHSSTEFHFVNSTIETPKVPQDLAVRALIRKQAMKKASAARRRDGNYGKHNLRQYPVFLFDQNNTAEMVVAEQGWEQRKEIPYRESQSVRVATDPGVIKSGKEQKSKPSKKAGKKGGSSDQWAARLALAETPPRNLSARGYELTSMKSDFDILDLSTLSTLHVNRAARAALSRNPYQLIYQLRTSKQRSYLSYLPSRYGQVPCLSDATDCVIARARQIISPGRNWEAAVISFYVKALDSLQKALDCPQTRFQPEVLCATEILALYELLDPTGEIAWVRHAAGAARLIQLRGPKNYTTEFEKALLMAHTGPIMTEALNNNERCFLEQPAWKSVMHSAIVEDALISDRSDVVIELMILKSNIPGFFLDVTNIMTSEDEPDYAHISRIASRIRQLRSDLLKWHDGYEFILRCAPAIYPGSAEYDRHCKVFATYLSCVIISSRLLGCLSASERADLEEETQMLAHQMLDLEAEVNSTRSAAGMFMAQTLGVAQATIGTAGDWLRGDWDGYGVERRGGTTELEGVSPESSISPISAGSESESRRGSGGRSVPEQEGLVEVWKFKKWNRLCGRRIE